ncbi:uncharacterized protein N7483_000603 [Penicillium malachiteum]|uniref:uncharacterized protein n=1 Tax=Penicillium malachiteum TaxID=1324776 RepID=UPI00254840D7|nr:uncharacterized protein N7483_000603 [Penicillium malachiteum]KAJ5735478.1 hypothetical protein N7483_000603 [Penicillium malachiteum]
MSIPISQDECLYHSGCPCPRHEYHSQTTGQPIIENQLYDHYWQNSQVSQQTNYDPQLESSSIMGNLNSFDMGFSKDQALLSSFPESNDTWQAASPHFMSPSAQASPFNSIAEPGISNEGLYLDTTMESFNSDMNMNAGFDANLPMQSFIPSPPFQSSTESAISTTSHSCLDYPLGSENSNEPIYNFSSPSSSLLPKNMAYQSLSASPLYSENSPIPTLNPPLESTTPSCLTQNLPSCILTATKSLRLLHTRQTKCLSRNKHGGNNTEPPRMSGSVLKDNKEVGMSVCRMLQCACVLRPQNQLLLATICSRLVVWYQTMIRTCFLRQGSNEIDNTKPIPEKVSHQAVTIGDHTVDNLALGSNIEAMIILGELNHLQRLVNTLSVRIRQTETLHSSGLAVDGDSPSAGLPGIAHDRLVIHLLKEVQTAREDLILALNQVPESSM